MRNLTIVVSLLISLSACNQATEQETQEQATQQQKVNTQSNTSKKVRDEDRFPLFFIEVAKNLNISTEEFAQAMQDAGGHEASMENVAKALGVSIEDLQAALPKRPPRKITFEPAAGVEVVEPGALEDGAKTNK